MAGPSAPAPVRGGRPAAQTSAVVVAVRRRGRRQPCDVPSLPHSLNSRFYPCGWRCDRHSPWAMAGHDSPTPRVNP